MKLILALILAAGMAYGQTTVNITNSLIGPVTQNFSNTQVNVSQAIITGAVVNASVTNSFAPVNNITNDINVGGATINNTVTNQINTSITNNISVAGVIVTNVTEAAVNIYNTTQVITSGVSSVSFTGAVVGAVVLTNTASEAVKLGQTSGTFTFDVNNQIPLIVANTNVSGDWQIDYTVGQAALYIQTGAITSQSFNVTSTNRPSSQLVVLRTSTNAITWRTNIIWAAGSAPTTDTSEDESFVFQTYRNKTRAGYLQDE